MMVPRVATVLLLVQAATSLTTQKTASIDDFLAPIQPSTSNIQLERRGDTQSAQQTAAAQQAAPEPTQQQQGGANGFEPGETTIKGAPWMGKLTYKKLRTALLLLPGGHNAIKEYKKGKYYVRYAVRMGDLFKAMKIVKEVFGTNTNWVNPDGTAHVLTKDSDFDIKKHFFGPYFRTKDVLAQKEELASKQAEKGKEEGQGAANATAMLSLEALYKTLTPEDVKSLKTALSFEKADQKDEDQGMLPTCDHRTMPDGAIECSGSTTVPDPTKPPVPEPEEMVCWGKLRKILLKMLGDQEQLWPIEMRGEKVKKHDGKCPPGMVADKGTMHPGEQNATDGTQKEGQQGATDTATNPQQALEQAKAKALEQKSLKAKQRYEKQQRAEAQEKTRLAKAAKQLEEKKLTAKEAEAKKDKRPEEKKWRVFYPGENPKENYEAMPKKVQSYWGPEGAGGVPWEKGQFPQEVVKTSFSWWDQPIQTREYDWSKAKAEKTCEGKLEFCYGAPFPRDIISMNQQGQQQKAECNTFCKNYSEKGKNVHCVCNPHGNGCAAPEGDVEKYKCPE